MRPPTSVETLAYILLRRVPAVQEEAVPFDRSVDNQVSRLRRKIEADPKSPELIKTVWGGGYSFSGEVERE